MKNGLNARAFGLSAGIIWGLCIFIMTFFAFFTGYGFDFMNAISKLYIGYTVSIFGAFVGAVYGFVDAFIAFYIFAWLYNFIRKKLKK